MQPAGQVHRFSGLTSAQYESLLTPAKASYISEVALFFRRLVHLVVHREWMTDAKLINRLYTHVKSPLNQNDTEVNGLFQRICVSCQSSVQNPATRHKLQEMQRILQSAVLLPYYIDPEELRSPFSIDLWCLGQDPKLVNNSKEVLDLESADPDRLKKLEELFAKNLASLSAHPHYKALYGEKLNSCLQEILSYYRADPLASKPENLLSKLYAQLCEIEAGMGITARFKEHVQHMVTTVMQDDPAWQKRHPELKNGPRVSPEALAKDVRLCRKYMIERRISDRTRFGERGKGVHQDVFDYLKTVLDPDCSTIIHNAGGSSVSVRQGCVMQDYSRSGHTNWVQACFESIGNHVVAHVYTTIDGEPHFVLLDNLWSPRQKTSLEKVEQMAKGWKNSTLQVQIKNPGHFTPPETPNPATWTLPKWERNNCFFCTALVAVSLEQFYSSLPRSS